MSDSIICARALEFADRVVAVCERSLWRRGPGARHIALQLIESGTSIGANAEEAQEAQTKPDYIERMSELLAMIRIAIWTARSRPDRGGP